MLSVTKIMEFHYAHHLPGYDGACANLHGHTGVIEVEVKSHVDIPSEMTNYQYFVIDFSKLKELINEKVVSKFDHANLNDVMTTVPSAENMVMFAVNELLQVLGDALIRVRIYETTTSYAEWTRAI